MIATTTKLYKNTVSATLWGSVIELIVNSLAGSQKVNYIIFPLSLHRICISCVRRSSTASERCSG